MTMTFEESRQSFTEAAQWFVDTADAVGDRWTDPGLGEWDVRALVGHTSRSLLTVESYLAQPSDEILVASAAEYYQLARDIASGAQVAERGREAGAALGPDPAGAVREIADRVLPLVEACDGTESVTTVVGGMLLAEYLPTRTFELVVHTCDLAVALGLDPTPPAASARQTLGVIADLVTIETKAGPLLLALTGRSGLPSGYTVL